MRINATQSLKTVALLLASGLLPLAARQAAPPASAPAPQLTLSTAAFNDGGEVPVKYTCAAKPSFVSPALQWSNVPKGTASFALIFHDADAHPGKGISDVTHWIVWNIPGSTTQLPEGMAASPKMDDGTVQGKNIRGLNGYMGPCAPAGKPHHYTFEIYALDLKVDLAPDAPRADVLKAMDGHIVGKAVYVGLFHQ